MPQVSHETLIQNGLYKENKNIKKIEQLTSNDLDDILGDPTEQVIEKAIFMDVSTLTKDEFKRMINTRNTESGNSM